MWFLGLGTLEIIGSGGAKPTAGTDELDLLRLHDLATAGHQAMIDGPPGGELFERQFARDSSG